MNFDNFTIKSQEAIQKAVEIVRNHNEQSIEPVHLLKGILQVGESLTSYLFQKLGVNAGLLNNQVDREIESLPKVNGGEPYLSRKLTMLYKKQSTIPINSETSSWHWKPCSWDYSS